MINNYQNVGIKTSEKQLVTYEKKEKICRLIKTSTYLKKPILKRSISMLCEMYRSEMQKTECVHLCYFPKVYERSWLRGRLAIYYISGMNGT